MKTDLHPIFCRVCGNPKPRNELAHLILCYGYTGAYMGLYAYALNTGSDFADFDWINCKYFQR
ncbi:MAG: hypothetical protein IPH45_02565 [Bacteroidales bacterium]|nr:hypothetical protein [Bacteroidales bacterium]